ERANAALLLAFISAGWSAPKVFGRGTSVACNVALGAWSPAFARATSAGALGESSGPALAERDVARVAEADATADAPALVGAARSRFTEAPKPATPVSPRESAICAGCSDG